MKFIHIALALIILAIIVSVILVCFTFANVDDVKQVKSEGESKSIVDSKQVNDPKNDIKVKPIKKEMTVNADNLEKSIDKPKPIVKEKKAQTKIEEINTSVENVNKEDIVKPKIKCLFLVQFNSDDSSLSRKVTIDMSLATHKGVFDTYQYDAKLEENKFTITWDIPGWYQSIPSKGNNFESFGNETIILNINSIIENFSINLYQVSTIELTFETPDGSLIKDGSNIKIQGEFFDIFDYEKVVKSQKILIHYRCPKTIWIRYLVIGKYFAEPFSLDNKMDSLIIKKIHLKSLTTVKAIFVNQNEKPLQGYYVGFFKETPNEWDIKNIRNQFLDNQNIENFRLGQFFLTDMDGKVEIQTGGLGEYFVYVIGPKKMGSIERVQLTVDGQEKQIKFNSWDGELLINFLENEMPCQKAFSFSLTKQGVYYYTYATNEKPLRLFGWPPGNYQIRIKSKYYINDVFEVTIPANDKKEINISLKKGSAIKGVIIENGVEIKNIKIELALLEKSNSIFFLTVSTDENGEFEFLGLDPDKMYKISIESNEASFKVQEPNAEFLPNKERILLNLIHSQILTCLVFDKFLKPAKNFQISYEVLQNKKVIKSGTSPYSDTKFQIQLDPEQSINLIAKLANHSKQYKSIIFDSKTISIPIEFYMSEGFIGKGIVYNVDNKPLYPAYIELLNSYDNAPPSLDSLTSTNEEGLFQIENCNVGEKYFVISKGNPPISFVFEEKHRLERIELKTIKSYSVSGTLKNQKGEVIQGILVVGYLKNTKQKVYCNTDLNGNYFFSSMIPGVWTFQFNILNFENKKTWHEVIITDKNETFDVVISVSEK